MKMCIWKADVIHVGVSILALVSVSRSPVASTHCTLPNVKPVLLHASFKTAEQAEFELCVHAKSTLQVWRKLELEVMEISLLS